MNNMTIMSKEAINGLNDSKAGWCQFRAEYFFFCLEMFVLCVCVCVFLCVLRL